MRCIIYFVIVGICCFSSLFSADFLVILISLLWFVKFSLFAWYSQWIQEYLPSLWLQYLCSFRTSLVVPWYSHWSQEYPALLWKHCLCFFNLVSICMICTLATRIPNIIMILLHMLLQFDISYYLLFTLGTRKISSFVITLSVFLQFDIRCIMTFYSHWP